MTRAPDAMAPPVNAVWTTVQTVLTFALLASVLRQLREPALDGTLEAPASSGLASEGARA